MNSNDVIIHEKLLYYKTMKKFMVLKTMKWLNRKIDGNVIEFDDTMYPDLYILYDDGNLANLDRIIVRGIKRMEWLNDKRIFIGDGFGCYVGAYIDIPAKNKKFRIYHEKWVFLSNDGILMVLDSTHINGRGINPAEIGVLDFEIFNDMIIILKHGMLILPTHKSSDGMSIGVPMSCRKVVVSKRNIYLIGNLIYVITAELRCPRVSSILGIECPQLGNYIIHVSPHTFIVNGKKIKADKVFMNGNATHVVGMTGWLSGVSGCINFVNHGIFSHHRMPCDVMFEFQ